MALQAAVCALQALVISSIKVRACGSSPLDAPQREGFSQGGSSGGWTSSSLMSAPPITPAGMVLADVGMVLADVGMVLADVGMMLADVGMVLADVDGSSSSM
ncbi:hypothetical protein Pcinc_044294 [Petrolisthes cinctipes]|uniref:Secreted protein n=1 Tax=Petrolisthes cinctipes TaxID=88211 RepID=A0AAE1EFE9_PETCI|nr:hypothetical protein Pcinc_044294 [Petrolisthes cinctipes]